MSTMIISLQRVLPVGVVFLLLAGCSGGGSNSSSSLSSTPISIPPPVVTFTIGGGISGLTTGGLTLVNGIDSIAVATNASTFALPIKLATGISYIVSVSTQPTGLTCTVTNGSGTVAAADIANIQVTCVANTYSIGGTISGLTASGLTLNNGADVVSPAKNATTFLFPTQLVSGTTYAVIISAQPTGLNCMVANASGMTTANISNVAVSCAAVHVAGWSTPTVVGTGVYPWLANDPSDVAFFLAWCDCIGGGGSRDVAAPSQASRYTDAGGWTTPVTMAMTQGGALAGLQFDAQGKGFALWSAPTGLNDGSVDSMYSRYLPGVGWSSGSMDFAVQLPPVTTPPNSFVFASHSPLGLSVSLDGTAITQVHELVQISTNGITTVNNESALSGGAVPGFNALQIGETNPLIPASDSSPSYTPGSNGQLSPYFAFTTWWPFDPMTPSTRSGQFATLFNVNNLIPGFGITTSFNLAMNTSVATGSTLTLATIDNTAGAVAYPIRVSKASTTIAANGDALTSWSVLNTNEDGVTVYAQRFVNGTWLARQVVFSGTNVNYDIYNALPVTALDGAGNGMIVFNSLGTLMSVKLNGTTGLFDTATQIATENSTPVSLQMDANGNAFLLVFGSVRRYDTTTGVWGAPVAAGGVQGDIPAMALDNIGGAMVAWSYGGSILATRYH